MVDLASRPQLPNPLAGSSPGPLAMVLASKPNHNLHTGYDALSLRHPSLRHASLLRHPARCGKRGKGGPPRTPLSKKKGRAPRASRKVTKAKLLAAGSGTANEQAGPAQFWKISYFEIRFSACDFEPCCAQSWRACDSDPFSEDLMGQCERHKLKLISPFLSPHSGWAPTPTVGWRLAGGMASPKIASYSSPLKGHASTTGSLQLMNHHESESQQGLATSEGALP